MDTKDWHHKMPYPTWPFGRVCPKELAKWSKQNSQKPPPAPF